MTCNQTMRTGQCALDEGHRGRHTTVVFVCSSCDRTYRGYPELEREVRVTRESEVDEILRYCFPCVAASGRVREPWLRL